MLAEKIGARSESLAQDDWPRKIVASQAVLPTSSPVPMYAKGNKLASGKVTMWSFGQAAKNELKGISLVRENRKFYR